MLFIRLVIVGFNISDKSEFDKNSPTNYSKTININMLLLDPLAIARNHAKKLEQLQSKDRQFYWLPDMSIAGFATKDQIKKNYELWHQNVSIPILTFRPE